MIRVMVVATSPVVRAGLSAVLTSNPRLTVVGSASDLDVLAKEVGQLQPDVVLVDLSSNLQRSVWEKLLSIQEEQYSLGMIVIVEELDSIDLETALRSGIRGILPSNSTESEVRNCRCCGGDRFWFSSAAPGCRRITVYPRKSGSESCPNLDTTGDRSFRNAGVRVGK
jgi:DNA-binding NarL/FixJ family response regulator